MSSFGKSTIDRFRILKTQEQLDFYVELCKQHVGGAIVELGIAEGGSAALLSLLAKPRKFVALELNPTPVPALGELIETRLATDTVRPIYGVNQADRERLSQIIDDEFGGDPLDLVIDDASHLLTETTASFEALFPCLRPGGLYVIEDWNAWHLVAEELNDGGADVRPGPTSPGNVGDTLPTPLSRLLMELLLVRATSGELVAEIRVGNLWATIERGPAQLDRATFRVTDHYRDHFGLLGRI